MININKRNTTIDSGRLIASFLVVCLHTNFPIPYIDLFVNDIAKSAVPFFFLVSGFYLYSDNQLTFQNRIIKTIRSLLLIILQAGIVYGILRFLKHFYYGKDISDQNFRLIPFLLLDDTRFTEHLWYLFAFFDVLLILWIMCVMKIVNYVILLLPIFAIIHFIFTIWSRVLPVDSGKFLMEFNWLVVALPFITMGLFLKKYFNIYYSLLNKNHLTILIFILMPLVLVEHYLFKQFVQRGPGVFVSAFFAITLFLYAILDLPFLSGKLNLYISNLGLKHSLNIYLYHVLIREIIELNGGGFLLNNTFIIFFLSLLLSIFIESLKEVFYKMVIK